MYRNKKDVDKHVDSLVYKLTPKDFQTRAYSIARLYFEVGDYGSCQKYVEQYLTQKSNNAAAHKLLGQAFQKLGEKEKALEQYKTSLDIDSTQTSTILEVCELLADDEVSIDTGRAKYWCEKAEAMFPKHPVTFRLRERLLAVTNPDPEALVKLIKTELETRPKDVVLHARLIKHWIHTNNFNEAFDYSCDIEFEKKLFSNNYAWYESLMEVLQYNTLTASNWLCQLLLLTVKERICVLSLTEVTNSSNKSLVESLEHLHSYDQAIEDVAKIGSSSDCSEFHTSLLKHHRGQIAFYAATYLLKKAKKGQLHWREAKEYSAPLMLIAWQTVPLDPKVNWLTHAPVKQQNVVRRWYLEGSYRCSQSGHFLLSNMQDKSQIFLDQVSQFCSGIYWKDKLYEKIFSAPEQLTKKKSSHLVSNAFNIPSLRLPRKTEVQAYDTDAQREYPNSLHHFVWILLNYKNIAEFKCTLFDMLTTTAAVSCGPETLNKMDVLAFLICATLTVQKLRDNKKNYILSEIPSLLPADITDLLCSLPQTKWWDCAYKFSQNKLGEEYTDIRSTLSRGIEVLRCIDNHGLDPELLCILGRFFIDKAKNTNILEEKTNLETRAQLYYSSAIPLLEKLKAKTVIKLPEKRMFDYTHKELSSKEINILLEESKLQIALSHIDEGEYEKVINMLSSVKTPHAYYQLSQTYKKMAEEDKSLTKSSDNYFKYSTLLGKAKHFAYKALDRIKNLEEYKKKTLYADIQSLIEELESCFQKIDTDFSGTVINDVESSDEYASISESGPIRSQNLYQNVSSTPKQTRHNFNINTTAFRTATDSQIYESTQVEHLERIEKQIKNLQKRETTIHDFMEQTKDWFEENRNLGQIINTINSNIEHTTGQFKLLKVSVDQVKEQIEECRNESKDVADMKKQIADLKMEVNKLKKTSSDQTIDENDVYNLDSYRANENTSAFGAQLPFTAPQVVPPFTQRLMPPFSVPSNPYHLYGPNLYNLYSQYSQFAQPPNVPGAPQIFDPTRTQMNYPGVFPTPDQMYLDVAHLVPPSIPTVPTIPTPHNIPVVPTIPSTSVQAPSTIVTTSKTSFESKEIPKSLPVNVVITSSDPMPTCTTAPAPVLSVIIPQKHIKGSPHNYQIPLPSSNDTKTVASPVFSFPSSTKTNVATTASIYFNWHSKSLFSSPQAGSTSTVGNINSSSKDSDNSKNVDGIFSGISPNTSMNKSRTLSERSNTSIENYDPCPDFKPIIPLPAEVKITTGEEDEEVIFNSRAKLFRFVDKQWKERGIGEMKLLKHKITGKVRVLMRREQVHKICANHIISPEMEIKLMKNETKAYCWVAHDFAEETVIVEKLCIRFKTVEVGKEFFDTFEKARKESVNLNAAINKSFDLKTNNKSANQESQVSFATSNLPAKENSANVQSGITVIGGFTFSSKPTFKTSVETTSNETKNIETPKNKLNVFSGLSFNAASFGNLNKTPDKITTEVTKLNTSDIVEDFEPTTEFKPVVPLPALVDNKTGEEDEIILFEHRAKLLRFDVENKEWKERGLGNIKLLVHKENNNKLRLLMRREQIMKLCCNHSVTKEMTFQKMPNMDKAVTWCAKDFSEGTLISETFCLRFKTAQKCDEFLEAIKAAQNKIGDDVKAVKEEQNAAKQNSQTGFGDKFKPKPGSWFCETCYTNNLESFLKCACCETPNPQQTSVSKDTSTNSSGWGDKFKPKPGSWECKECFIRNDADREYCNACNSPKDGTVKKPDVKLNEAPKFNFGIPSSGTLNHNKIETISNAKTTDSSVFGTNNVQKFTFGIPKAETLNLGGTTKSLNISSVFSTAKTSNENENPMNYSASKNETTGISVTPVKTALLQTPNKNVASFGKGSATFEFSFKPKTPTKGKSPLKSPKEGKPHTGDDSDENSYVSEDEGHHIHFSPVIPMPDKIQVVTGEENEEELYCHRAKLFVFNKEWKERGIGNVKVLKHKKTGNLRVLMRREQVHKICLNHALVPDISYKPKDDKTWLFYANDFSEGEVVLQHFCLRFKNKEIAVQFKDAVDKAISSKFDSIESKNLSCNKTIDTEDVVFINEIHASIEEKQKAKELMLPEHFYTYKNKEPCQGCRGCDDNNDEGDASKPEKEKSTKINLLKIDSAVTTPFKSPVTAFASPNNSVYGTPSNADRSLSTTLFRTPLSDIKSNTTLAASPATFNLSDSNTTDKENTLTENTNANMSMQPISFVTSGVLQNQSAPKTTILAAPKLNTLNTSTDSNAVPKSLFGSADTKSYSDENKPVFSTNNQFASKPTFNFSLQSNKGGSQLSDTQSKSVFSDTNFSQVNLFSNTSQESLFGPAALKNTQSKPPIFGTGTFGFGKISEQNQENKPQSIFGASAPMEQKKGLDFSNKIQIENVAQQNTNNSVSKPLETFETSKEKSDSLGKLQDMNKLVSEPITKTDFAGKEPILKVDNALTFENLSSGPGFNIQKKADFQWEGAGQQLFVSGSTKESDDKSRNDSHTADEGGAAADEEYDPHYEPIVPLPDKITVSTGEEDEEKLFGERCKLFRFDEKSRDWKERGVGEMKILHHPERNTYRLLLRREQVHKAVLNMLLFMDLELLPMKNSDRAWTWAGKNYAESAGEQETLAVRFKNVDLAKAFYDKVMECVRKLQASAADAIRKEKEEQNIKFESVAPLRLPRHLEENARADKNFTVIQTTSAASKPDAGHSKDIDKKENGEAHATSDMKQLRFEEPEKEPADYDDEDYKLNYEHPDDYNVYYHGGPDEDASVYYPCKAVIRHSGSEETYDETQVDVSFDQDMCSPKILVTDFNTGEIIADMLIHTDTEFQMSGDTCSWKGLDFTTNASVEKTVIITFTDSDMAMEFYDNCETSKGASYASTDPES